MNIVEKHVDLIRKTHLKNLDKRQAYNWLFEAAKNGEIDEEVFAAVAELISKWDD